MQLLLLFCGLCIVSIAAFFIVGSYNLDFRLPDSHDSSIYRSSSQKSVNLLPFLLTAAGFVICLLIMVDKDT